MTFLMPIDLQHCHPRRDLWQDEPHRELTPGKQPWAQVVPQLDECEDQSSGNGKLMQLSGT